ncbi:hypothetical protein L226DRAFT_533805 [Lentinus tigrinus ALCF2SS1-7]|uniref:uncharacterized protein n=1 Tax=Lentinus tigrinus ALCF2SS1-7 TaxID=1328758 RepID=UPI00116609A9|nr:hypothetical protein L226DRAFT_533805 [Lentinus tigrinus ALCF2SS1-7]
MIFAGCCPELRRLSLFKFAFHTFYRLVRVVRSFPELQDLKLIDIHWKDREEKEDPWEAPDPALHSGRCGKLQTVKLTMEPESTAQGWTFNNYYCRAQSAVCRT